MKTLLLLAAGFFLGYMTYKNKEKIKTIFAGFKTTENTDTQSQTSTTN